MIEIKPLLGVARDLSAGECAPEAKFYRTPREGELSVQALGLDASIWEWRVVNGELVLIARV